MTVMRSSAQDKPWNAGGRVTVLFEVASNVPGFDRDEDTAHLGDALKLPSQHAHLRPYLESHLQPLDN